MFEWMQYYKSEIYDIPNTTEEWQRDFNGYIFNNIQDDSITMTNEVKEEDTASKKNKNTTRMQIRI